MQPVAQEAAPQAAEEGHRLRQPRQADGHVQRAAADARVQQLAGGVAPASNTSIKASPLTMIMVSGLLRVIH
jgi:hypothetical protein